MKPSPATQRKPKARTLTADSPLPYPRHPRGDSYPSEDFRCWLFWWFRSFAQAESLLKLAKKPSKKALPEALEDGLWHGARIITEDAEDSLKHLVRTGGLLFAWAGTTALQVET